MQLFAMFMVFHVAVERLVLANHGQECLLAASRLLSSA